MKSLIEDCKKIMIIDEKKVENLRKLISDIGSNSEIFALKL